MVTPTDLLTRIIVYQDVKCLSAVHNQKNSVELFILSILNEIIHHLRFGKGACIA